ncbi:Copper Transporter integral membrane protein that functions in high affinity copper transport, partial [Peltigera leucophlebia]|nr:Copper Transporter integral membrane protein that functions in high affinity copper transport [Peltigera leucophlebia]
SCIGVILLVMSLEFLRRVGREYERYILAERTRNMRRLGGSSASNNGLVEEGAESMASTDRQADGKTGLMTRNSGFKTTTTAAGESKGRVMIRPTLLQQLIRAGLHMITFAVAYFVMLLAMYYNGYFIICILIGAFIGAFIFSWETVGAGNIEEREVTGCCG